MGSHSSSLVNRTEKSEENMSQQKCIITENPELLNFVFPDDDIDDPNNGYCFNQVYLPEELLIHIFSYIPVSELLKIRLVCKKWHNLLKTHAFWATKYFRKYLKVSKPLPWYVFYASFRYSDVNLLKNNCGQKKFAHWIILANGGNRFKVEASPVGSDPYPIDCPDFKGSKKCFVTSYSLGHKVQDIPLQGKLINFIINKHKPHIYISEWVSGRFDCGGSYILEAFLYSAEFKGIKKPNQSSSENWDELFLHSEGTEQDLENGILTHVTVGEYKYVGGESTKWRKMELLLEDYPDGVKGILFSHKGQDNQFWAGHYGPKMAGGVVKLLFDSIKPESCSSIHDSEMN